MKIAEILPSCISTLSSSDIIAISAVLISLLALGATIWQGVMTRTHNILSVKPFIDFEKHISKNSDILFAIKNSGIGTAIVTAVRIENNGYSQEFKSNTLGELAKKYPIRWVGGHVTHIDPPTALSPGESIRMIEIEKIEDQKTFENTMQLLKDSTIHIEYECMYGKKHKTFNTCA